MDSKRSIQKKRSSCATCSNCHVPLQLCHCKRSACSGCGSTYIVDCTCSKVPSASRRNSCMRCAELSAALRLAQTEICDANTRFRLLAGQHEAALQTAAEMRATEISSAQQQCEQLRSAEARATDSETTAA